MPHVTGIGGVFIKSKHDPKALTAWYQENLEGLIVTFTMWDWVPGSTGIDPAPSDFLPLVKAKTCAAAAR